MKGLSKLGTIATLTLLHHLLCAQSTEGTSVAERFLLQAANVDRAQHGLPALVLDPALSTAALAHAQQMARHAGISHQFDGEPELAQRAAAAGARFSTVTENVAQASDASRIHDLWMHSAGHRANLLDATVDSVGIAVLRVGGQFYAVEDFARTVPQLTLEQQESTVAQLVEATGVSVAPTTSDARSTCALPTGSIGPRKPWFTMRYTGADLHRLPPQLQQRLQTGNYHEAVIAACHAATAPFTGYSIAVLLYP